jgi:NADP-reducing hydrogenase subunit HndB
MTEIRSLEDLKRYREQALEKREQQARKGNSKVLVAMGTCGIAAGARETLLAILNQIEISQLQSIAVNQTGCIGLCAKEPIIQVLVGTQPKVIYGKVTPEAASRILKEHILGGSIVKEYVIEA